MQFFPFKLRQSDQQQFNQIKNQISEIRLLVNRLLDNLEKELFQKVDQLIQNKNNDQLKKMQELVFQQRISDPDLYLNEINFQLSQFTKCNENKLIHHADDELNLLNFQLASKLLSNTQMFLKAMFTNVTLKISQNQKIANTKVISTQSENDQNQIWKHKSISKTNDRDTSFTFSKNYGLAENILALSNLVLIGIFITPLFKGINQFDQDINDQDKEVKFCLKIHEGIDMSQFIYSEELIIKHQQQKLVNKCYEIILKEGVILRQGLVYTLSITSLYEGNINLHMFQGKCVNFGGDLKFLGKETENMSQIVNIKQNISQSCMPGILISK